MSSSPSVEPAADEPFDPIAVEARMIVEGVLPARIDDPAGPLGEHETLFTEHDDRYYALWRISMVRQFGPAALDQLSNDDLLYLAGQSPEGYPDKGFPGIALNRNKVVQNAQRARVVLELRQSRLAFWRSVSLVAGGAILGFLLTLIGSLL